MCALLSNLILVCDWQTDLFAPPSPSHAILSQTNSPLGLFPPPFPYFFFVVFRATMSRSGPHRGDPPPFEPLPDNRFSRRTHPSWHDAYARCVGLFFWAVGRHPPAGTASYDMCSRVLGHLVLEAPAELGRDWVCRRILGCTDEYALARLAQKYIFTFVAACASSASLSATSFGSEHFVFPQKLRRPQDHRRPRRVADSGKELVVARPSRRRLVIVARAAPLFPPIRRRGCSCAFLTPSHPHSS
jgi:hypothetical protein